MADSTNYEPVLLAKALSTLVGLPKTKQKELFDLLFQLSEAPSQLGNYVIAFWSDHAVKEFRIIDIHRI